MSFQLPEIDISNAILLVTTAGASLSAALISVQKKLRSNVVSLINAAEKEYANQEKAGVNKHTWVVYKLYQLVPQPLRPLFSYKLINNIVVSTFGGMESYVDLQEADHIQIPLPSCAEISMHETPIAKKKEPNQLQVFSTRRNSEVKKERRKRCNVTKAYPAYQQVPDNRLIQNRRLQSSVRVHTLWNRHGIVRGADYHIRKWER